MNRELTDLRIWLGQRRAELVKRRKEADTVEARNRLRVREEELTRVDEFVRSLSQPESLGSHMLERD